MTNQNPNPCSIDGCGKPAIAKGLCAQHYMRARRHGSPDVTLPPGPKKSSGDMEITHATPNARPAASWRDLIRVHPAAEMFPLMSPEDLQALAEDIKAYGLREPITTWVDGDEKEWLLDGRNRLDALEIAGYRFKLHAQMKSDKSRDPERFRVLAPNGVMLGIGHVHHYLARDPDPFAFVISANIHRRHLTTDQRKAIAVELLKADTARSNRSVAAEVKLDDKTIAQVRKDAEASADIPHIQPTDRVDAGGRKRARKSAQAASAPIPEDRIGEPAPQPDVAGLGNLPFDDNMDGDTDWTEADTADVEFVRAHPKVRQWVKDVSRAFKRCTEEERVFIWRVYLQTVLDDWKPKSVGG